MRSSFEVEILQKDMYFLCVRVRVIPLLMCSKQPQTTLYSFCDWQTGALQGSVASKGGGVQEGVSQRAIAVSLLDETEEYRSLKGVLESRRGEKGDLWAMVRNDCARVWQCYPCGII